MDEPIRRFAEDPSRYLPEPAPPGGRIVDERFVLTLGPTPHRNLVSSVDVEPDRVKALVEEIRDLARPERRRMVWAVGPSSRPRDLLDRLLALGFVVAATPPFESPITAMALVGPPKIGSTDGMEVRVVGSRADYLASDEVMNAGLGVSEDERAAMVAAIDDRYAAFVRRPDLLRFLALADGVPVAAASATACALGLFLGGAATLAGARGGGAYRALVRARWDEAVRRGTPALAIQAGKMSAPILARVGFESVCELAVLLDPATHA